MYTNARYFNIGPHLNPFGHINKAHKEFYLASHEFFYSTLKDETIQNLEIFVYDPTMMKMCKNLSSSRWYKKSNRNFQQMGGPYPSTFIIEKLTFENVHCNIAHSFQGIRACKCYGQTDRKHYTITHFDRLPPVRWQKVCPNGSASTAGDYTGRHPVKPLPGRRSKTLPPFPNLSCPISTWPPLTLFRQCKILWSEYRKGYFRKHFSQANIFVYISSTGNFFVPN